MDAFSKKTSYGGEKMNIQQSILYFIPTPDQRKEKKRQKNKDFQQRMYEEQHIMKEKTNNGVHMSAYDPWAIRLRKATEVKRVIITTDIPLPRKDWLEVYKLLKKKIQKRRKQQHV
jgi:hypothetical protein